MFTRAITRLPGSNYADGLTTVDLGVPDYQKTLGEYAHYLSTLRQCGLTLVELLPDLRFPDGTFVEDTAILVPESPHTKAGAILTRPGAASRAGEVFEIKEILKKYYPVLAEIEAPGCLDGGDICEAGTHFFIGISQRTNQAGAQQLAIWLSSLGFTSSMIDIRQVPGILHLKSGLSYIGDNRLVVIESLADHPDLNGYELIHSIPGEEYAANCIRVNDYIIIPAGFPNLESTLHDLGYSLFILEMSEFQKMDGGLSCLSLRF